MEKDGAAWLAWAKKQGRLQVLSQPRVMTQDNQPAHISIGRVVPIGRPEPGTHGPAKSNHDQTEQVQVGLTVDVTPRVSPEGLVVVALDVERTSLVDLNGAAGPTIGRTGVQTTVSAKDGHTIIVGGLMVRAEDGHRGTIIAVTPRVNPKR
jgi:type II secretory pathway component GspD/PulD (secretin)